MDKTQILDDIFSNDPLGILEVKQKSSAMNADERLVNSFRDINKFFEENNRVPERTTWLERRLFSRLKAIREDKQKVDALLKYDKYNLLSDINDATKIESISDIFDDDNLWIFEEEEEKKDIFKLVNVPEIDKERADADHIAHRKKCDDFEEYEPLFINCHQDLKDGTRKIYPYDETTLHEGMFCILNGVLLFIAKVEKWERGSNWRINKRTLLIFENWTESKMLLRSLWKRLNENWKMISPHVNEEETLFNKVTKDDQQSWFIYILRSLSNDDRILTKRNLYKIWFSTTPVEERIKDAENDPTYLMAGVKIVETFECYNLNPQKLERMLHKLFWSSCLDVEIIDNKWIIYKPREWFIVPLEVIEEAIDLIVRWEITNYKYNAEKEEIIYK